MWSDWRSGLPTESWTDRSKKGGMMQSLMRFLVRANMRRIKKVGKEIVKDIKKEDHGKHPVSNSMGRRGGSVGHTKVQKGRGKGREEERSKGVVRGTRGKEEAPREVPRERYEEDPPVNKHIEEEIMRGPNIAAELDEKDPERKPTLPSVN